jgi:hypothetical protein
VRILDDVTGAIGETPLVRLRRLAAGLADVPPPTVDDLAALLG